MVKFVIESDDLFDVTEAAKLLGRGYATIYRWIASGKVIPVRMDNRTLIPRSEIERLKREINEQAASKPAA
ncbi:hypothetical protein ES703_84163 [subsurface metagenome]